MAEPRRLPIPLYFQIANDLEDQIKSGALMPDEQLPNEKELARSYGVSLVTVRGATRVLLEKGVLVRYPGRGTYVGRLEDASNIWSIGSLDDLVATGLKSTMHVLSQGQVDPPRWVLDRLGLPLGARAHMVRALREARGEPFMVTDQYQPPDLAGSLRKADFARPEARSRLVVQIVAERCGLTIGSVRQTMSAEKASREMACLLRLQPGDPLLVVERDYLSDQGRVFQTGRAHYRTDHHRYVITVSHLEGASRRNVYQLPLRRQVGRRSE
jgi:GntR family transcriptional regulator